MEFQFPLFSILFTFLLFFLMVAKVLKRPQPNNPNPKLLPGPRKLPLIGNLHQIAGQQLPHHALRDLAKKYGPLVHLQLGQVSTIIVSSPELAKEIMKTHDVIFAQRPSLLAAKILMYDCKGIGSAPYGNYWRQLRKICTIELLSATRVQTFKPIRQEEVSNFIRAISSNKGSPINLSEKLFSMSYSITSRTAFGNKCNDQEAFISLITELTELASGFCVADMYPSIQVLQLISGIKYKLEKLHQDSDKILQNIINDHRERKAARKSSAGEAEKDLVDVLLKFQEDGDLEFPLTDNNIKAVILDIFAAGSETSSTTVEWAMSEMIKNPRVMKEAQAEVRRVFSGKENVDEAGIHELKFLKSVIKETLRLHPAVPLLLPRESSESCELKGYDIPIKTRVIINAWAIGRDPKYWRNPDTFYPERFLGSSIDYKGTDFEYIPFGAGRRICPGMLYALPNVELPLAQLLYHFDWKLPGETKQKDLDMTEAFGLTVRRKNDLLLIPIPYNPLSTIC